MAANGGDPLVTSTVGTVHLDATAKDVVGNQTHDTKDVQVVKATPTVSWPTPAPISYGTKLSAIQLNATASANGASLPGTFVYSPPAGTVLQPGSQPLSVTFTPTDTAHYTTATGSTTISVGFSQVCLTTGFSGSLTIKNGQAYCISTGGSVSGSITVQSGGSLWINGGSVSGPISATGAKSLTMCGANLSGSLSVSGSTGAVLIGGAPGTCAANKISGSVSLSGNTAGVSLVNTTVSGCDLDLGQQRRRRLHGRQALVLRQRGEQHGRPQLRDQHDQRRGDDQQQQRWRRRRQQQDQRLRDDHEQHRRLHVLRKPDQRDADSQEQQLAGSTAAARPAGRRCRAA